MDVNRDSGQSWSGVASFSSSSLRIKRCMFNRLLWRSGFYCPRDLSRRSVFGGTSNFLESSVYVGCQSSVHVLISYSEFRVARNSENQASPRVSVVWISCCAKSEIPFRGGFVLVSERSFHFRTWAQGFVSIECSYSSLSVCPC